MNEQNKSNVAAGAKVLALVVFGLLTIATCAGVWNYCPEIFVKYLAGALFASNGFAIYKLAKKANKSEPKPEK